MKKQLISIFVLALLILVACKQEQPAPAEESESPDYAVFDKRVETVRSFIQAHCDENLAGMTNMMADTLKWSPASFNGNEWLGKADFIGALKAYHDGYENIKFTEGLSIGGDVNNGMWSGSVFPQDQASVSADVIRIYGTWSGTHTESGKDIGVKYYALGWVNDDGKISQWSDYFDVNGLAVQIADSEDEAATE
jgi:hypothetical protein